MAATVTSKPVMVLYVEDEETDVFFMREAFKRIAPEVELRAVGDGQQAVDYLAGRNGYEERTQHPVPSVVLLDLNLPVLHGFEVLKWMRQQPQFKELPVIVFSSSPHGLDKQSSDELGANAYLQKPNSVRQFCDAVEQVKKRWLSPGKAPVAGESGGQPTLRMRKLVQNMATKAFLAPDGAWTADCRRAQVFPTTEAARAAVEGHGLRGVELYYLFDEETTVFDFTISLKP